jgi:hypothetical protein
MNASATARSKRTGANLRPFYAQLPPAELKQALKRICLIGRFEEGAEDA